MNFKSHWFDKKKKPVIGVNHGATMRGVKPIPRRPKLGWLAQLIAHFDRPTNKVRA